MENSANNHRPKTDESGNPIETIETFWDCNCSTNYIHPKSSGGCTICKADYEANPHDYADSRIEELREPTNLAHVQQMIPHSSSLDLDCGKKYSASIAFGSDAINRLEGGDRSALTRFSFNTQNELDAFIRGIVAMDGWNEMAVDGWV